MTTMASSDEMQVIGFDRRYVHAYYVVLTITIACRLKECHVLQISKELK